MIEKMGQEGGWDMLLQVSLFRCSVVSERIADGWGMLLGLPGRDACCAVRSISLRVCRMPRQAVVCISHTPGPSATQATVAEEAFTHCQRSASLVSQLLSNPERLGDYLWAFLMPLATAVPAMLPEARHKLGVPIAAILQYIRAGLAAVADLSALEGSASNPEARVARVRLAGTAVVERAWLVGVICHGMQLLRQVCSACSLVPALPTSTKPP